jgi:hypothetical protein
MNQAFFTLAFSWVTLCFSVACLSGLRCAMRRDWAFLAAGMAFTLVADYFLILHDSQPIGLAVFCCTHIMYFLRAAHRRCRAIPFITIVCALPFMLAENFFVLSALYAVLFMEEVIVNIYNLKHNISGAPFINRAITLAGVLLFALCDINVFFFNLPRFLPAPVWLAEDVSFTLLWIFYIPAQFLLAISALSYGKK